MSRKTAVSLAAAAGALATLALAPPLVLRLAPSPRALGLDAAFTSLFLTLVAVALTARSAEPLAWRLGLGPGRLSLPRTSLLVLGLVGLSQTLEGAIHLVGLDGAGGALAEIDATVGGARGADLAWLLVGAAGCAGVGEELFARGWIQRGLARRFGPGVGLLVSSSVFGALHGDTIHAAAAFGLGLYLGIMAEATAAIRAGIAAHVVNNAIALSTSAFGLAALDGAAGASAALAGAVIALLGLAAARPGPAVAAPAAVPARRSRDALDRDLARRPPPSSRSSAPPPDTP